MRNEHKVLPNHLKEMAEEIDEVVVREIGTFYIVDLIKARH